MKDNFINSMLGEGGKISHKRFISVVFALCGCWAYWFIVSKYKEFAVPCFNSVLLFIAVMSGVATVPQIVQLIKGIPTPTEPQKQNTDVQPNSGNGSSGAEPAQ
jgi:hypothetical protein